MLGALCWTLCIQTLGVELAVAFAWQRPYNFVTHYVSDLGDSSCGMASNVDGSLRYVCSPWHTAMNASFVTFGALALAGLLLTREVWPRGGLTTVGLVLIGLATIGPIIIGFNPENVHFWVHGITGAVEFPLQNAGMVLLGVACWRRLPRLGRLSVCSGVVGAVGTALYFTHGYDGLGAGAIERVAVDPFAIWLVAVGLWLLAEYGAAPWVELTAKVGRTLGLRRVVEDDHYSSGGFGSSFTVRWPARGDAARPRRSRRERGAGPAIGRR